MSRIAEQLNLITDFDILMRMSEQSIHKNILKTNVHETTLLSLHFPPALDLNISRNVNNLLHQYLGKFYRQCIQ